VPQQLVESTTRYELDRDNPLPEPVIAPVSADLVLLSSIGSSVELAGNWRSGHTQLEVAKWLHRSTLGRDNYVRVETRGFLFPFGHRATLTTVATGRRTGERRVAGPSTVHVLEGEVKFQVGEERHMLSAGGTFVLEGNVPYEAEALSDSVFLHTLVLSGEEIGAPRSVHPTEPAEGRADLDLPGAGHAS
jgi:quercetin dioxygenase-like cupin family protein